MAGPSPALVHSLPRQTLTPPDLTPCAVTSNHQHSGHCVVCNRHNTLTATSRRWLSDFGAQTIGPAIHPEGPRPGARIMATKRLMEFQSFERSSSSVSLPARRRCPHARRNPGRRRGCDLDSCDGRTHERRIRCSRRSGAHVAHRLSPQVAGRRHVRSLPRRGFHQYSHSVAAQVVDGPRRDPGGPCLPQAGTWTIYRPEHGRHDGRALQRPAPTRMAAPAAPTAGALC